MIYDDKPVMRAIIEALGAEMDELNQAIIDCKNNRWVDKAQGKQLDGLGEIVVLSRQIDKAIAMKLFGFLGQPNVFGFGQARFRGHDEDNLQSYILEDAEYRMAIAIKAVMNATQCTAEDTLQSLRYVFNAPIVMEEIGNANINIAIGRQLVMEEIGNANINIAIGRQLTDNEKILANAINLIVRAGGVGVNVKSYFPTVYFGFLGQPNAHGFGVGSFAHIF